MTHRRTAALVSAGLALSGGVSLAAAATPSTAAAEGACSAELDLVPRWGLSPSTAGYAEMIDDLRFVGDCETEKQGYSLRWRAEDPTTGAYQGDIELNWACGAVMPDIGYARFRDKNPPVGIVQFERESGVTTCGDAQIPSTGDSIDVRAMSWGYLATSRSGSTVNLTVRGLRFWTSTGSNGNWAGAKGVIQYRDAGSSTWKSLKNVVTDGTGHDAYAYTTSAKRSYRVLFPNQPTIWGSVSQSSSTT